MSSNSMGVADLAEHEAEARENLLLLLRELGGNRRLSSWHRNFLAGVTAQVGACRSVTSKQWAKIYKLEAAAREEAETVADLFHLLQWLKGDPRLSASEEKFLSCMVAQLRAGDSPGRQQWAIIHSLTPLTETEPEVVNWP